MSANTTTEELAATNRIKSNRGGVTEPVLKDSLAREGDTKRQGAGLAEKTEARSSIREERLVGVHDFSFHINLRRIQY